MRKGIQKIFAKIPRTYEMINHLLTFGLDVIWRRKAALEATAGNGSIWIDMCTGTGEMAANLRQLAQKNTMVVSTDFSLPMMRKSFEKSESNHIDFILADVKFLPFRDMTFDLVTISFATRNINVSQNILIRCLREFYRILKSGGRFINLETSQPSSIFLRRLFHLYAQFFIRSLGQFISGSRLAYVYLSHTIPRFYNADELADIVRQAGFVEITFTRMLQGIAAIHKAVK